MMQNKQGILDTLALLKAAIDDGRESDARNHLSQLGALMGENDPTVEDIIGSHSGGNDRREWWSGGAWLYPGDDVVILRTERP